MSFPQLIMRIIMPTPKRETFLILPLKFCSRWSVLRWRIRIRRLKRRRGLFNPSSSSSNLSYPKIILFRRHSRLLSEVIWGYFPRPYCLPHASRESGYPLIAWTRKAFVKNFQILSELPKEETVQWLGTEALFEREMKSFTASGTYLATSGNGAEMMVSSELR